VRLSTVAVFGAGYVLGTRAGRQRYDQLRSLAQRLASEFDDVGVRQRLATISSRLENYAREGSFDAPKGGRRVETPG
jgi:hypothetical protein